MSFAGLLRGLRAEAGFTQEELAEAAGLSVRGISDLERGVNLTARRDTARRLARALGLAGEARAAFEAAARGQLQQAATAVAAATRTLPRDIASFTGREREIEDLSDLAGHAGSARVAGLCAIDGMAGVGKTTFAVHAAHRLVPLFPDGQIFLPLHGHTPGQQPVSPADALASLLLITGVAAENIPPGLEARTALWRDRLAQRQVLLVLDDAAGHDQVRPLLPASPGCLVLVTSRRHLTALEDAHTISLDVLPPVQAADLLVRLADRPMLSRDDPAVAEIVRQCGHLPLAIGMLARQLHHHPSWSTTRLAAELAATRDRLDLMHAEDLSVTAAFDLSYDDLSGSQQRLFRRLGLHPGTEFDAYAAAALDNISVRLARRDLEVLYDHHLLTEPGHGRYGMHDLVAEHARARVSGEPAPDREYAVRRLLDYYLYTALAAADHLPRRPPACPPALTGSPPAQAPQFRRREQAAAWMEAERLNLNSAASHAAIHGHPEYATGIAAAMHGFLRGQSYWDQAISLHQLAVAAARQADDWAAEARALVDLGDTQYLLVAYPQSIASFTQALSLYRKSNDLLGEASALSTLGVVQYQTDDISVSTASKERALALYRQISNLAGEATALNRLGWNKSATGDHQTAAEYQRRAITLFRQIDDMQGEANATLSLADVYKDIGESSAAISVYARAMHMACELGSRILQAHTFRGLAEVHLAIADHQEAAAELNSALELYRDLGSRLGEAYTLPVIAAAHQAMGDNKAAAAALLRALHIEQILNRPRGQAYVLNSMGDLAKASGLPDQARAYYEQALALGQPS